MATRTSSQSGDWSSSSTWGGAAAPGIGDIANIGTAAHVVTVSSSTTVGDDVGTAITLVGSLVVNAPLEIRTGTSTVAITQQRTSSVTVSRVGSNTGSITFNPTSGTTPHWDTPNTGSGTATITITGESGDLVPISTSLGRSGNRAYFDFTGRGPTINWDYVQFTDMGGTGDTVSTRFMSYTGVGADSITMDYVRFKSGIGKLHFALDSADFTFDLRNCDFRGMRLNDCLQINNSVAKTSGTRQFLNCTGYDSAATRNWLLWCNDFTFDGGAYCNIRFLQDIQELNNTFKNFVHMTDTSINGIIGGREANGTLVDEVVWLTNNDNPHYISNSSGSAGGATPQVTRNVADGFGFVGSDAGDFYLGAGGAIILDRCLLINRAGSLFSVLDIGARITAKRCTLYGVGTFANCGESVSNAANLVRVSSCLFSSQPAALIFDTLTAQTGFTCDYNGFFEQTDPNNLDHPTLPGNRNSYLENGTWWSTGAYGDDTKGLHDIYGDPQFSDPSWNTIAWYNQNAGSGGSFTNVRAEMLKLNGTAADGTDATFNGWATADSLKASLRDAFTPQNSIYFAAGAPADGTPDIGAVPVVPPPPPVQVSWPRRSKFRRRVIAADCA